MYRDATEIKLTDLPDDECLPIECICGYGKKPWTFIISIYSDNPDECPQCGRKYYFKQDIQVFVEE